MGKFVSSLMWLFCALLCAPFVVSIWLIKNEPDTFFRLVGYHLFFVLVGFVLGVYFT